MSSSNAGRRPINMNGAINVPVLRVTSAHCRSHLLACSYLSAAAGSCHAAVAAGPAQTGPLDLVAPSVSHPDWLIVDLQSAAAQPAHRHPGCCYDGGSSQGTVPAWIPQHQPSLQAMGLLLPQPLQRPCCCRASQLQQVRVGAWRCEQVDRLPLLLGGCPAAQSGLLPQCLMDPAAPGCAQQQCHPTPLRYEQLKHLRKSLHLHLQHLSRSRAPAPSSWCVCLQGRTGHCY